MDAPRRVLAAQRLSLHRLTLPITSSMKSLSYKLALAGTVIGSLLLIWMSLGIGIIGADGEPLNVVYAAVILVGIIGAIRSRLGAAGMAKTLYAMATVQAIIAVIAIVMKWGMPYSPPLELAMLNGFYVVVFTVCAQLFRFSLDRAEVTL